MDPIDCIGLVDVPDEVGDGENTEYTSAPETPRQCEQQEVITEAVNQSAVEQDDEEVDEDGFVHIDRNISANVIPTMNTHFGVN
jgi:hypothetical protein